MQSDQSLGAASAAEPTVVPAGGRAELLLVRDVSKQFGGTQALHNVGMHLNGGEIAGSSSRWLRRIRWCKRSDIQPDWSTL
jgi:hypothetical protein